jgi:hypothetical protein
VPTFPEHPAAGLEVVRQSRDLTRRAAEVGAACEQRWPAAGGELRALQQRLRQVELHLETVRGVNDLDEVQRQLEQKAALLADALMPSLQRLDILISGKNEQGDELPLPAEAGLPARLREVRNLVFAFVNRFGRWEEYLVEAGEPLANHVGNLQVVGSPRLGSRPVIRQMLHPGYRKPGYPPKKPRVYVSG